jgi:hypothetical protein
VRIIYFIIVCLLYSFGVYASEGVGGSPLGGARANVYTYPSISRHEQRFWDNTRFLYEKSQNKTGAGDLDCVNDALATLYYNMNYYRYNVKSDTKIVTNLKNRPDNVGIVIFSSRLTEEASLLPSGGDMSPVLFFSSLLKRMCPNVLTQTSYSNYGDTTPKGYYDYVLFQYQK